MMDAKLQTELKNLEATAFERHSAGLAKLEDAYTDRISAEQKGAIEAKKIKAEEQRTEMERQNLAMELLKKEAELY